MLLRGKHALVVDALALGGVLAQLLLEFRALPRQGLVETALRLCLPLGFAALVVEPPLRFALVGFGLELRLALLGFGLEVRFAFLSERPQLRFLIQLRFELLRLPPELFLARQFLE
jgi:hypothetical protein